MIEVLIGAVVGAFLTWLFTIDTLNHGKLHVGINNGNYENDSGVCTISFEVVLFNDKRDRGGINNCKVISEYDSGTSTEFISLFSSENDKDELTELLNVDAKTVKTARYLKSGLEYSGNTKYYFEYTVNGKKKKKRIFIV